MGLINWMHELDPVDYLLPDCIAAGEHVIIKRGALEKISAYETTVPTAPSAGRVYRRTTRDGVVLFVVQDAPPEDKRGGQLHHPLTCLIIEEE